MFFLVVFEKLCSGFLVFLFLTVEKCNGFPFLMSPKFNGSFLVRVSYIKGLRVILNSEVLGKHRSFWTLVKKQNS